MILCIPENTDCYFCQAGKLFISLFIWASLVTCSELWNVVEVKICLRGQVASVFVCLVFQLKVIIKMPNSNVEREGAKP